MTKTQFKPYGDDNKYSVQMSQETDNLLITGKLKGRMKKRGKPIKKYQYV